MIRKNLTLDKRDEFSWYTFLRRAFEDSSFLPHPVPTMRRYPPNQPAKYHLLLHASFFPLLSSRILSNQLSTLLLRFVRGKSVNLSYTKEETFHPASLSV